MNETRAAQIGEKMKQRQHEERIEDDKNESNDDKDESRNQKTKTCVPSPRLKQLCPGDVMKETTTCTARNQRRRSVPADYLFVSRSSLLPAFFFLPKPTHTHPA